MPPTGVVVVDIGISIRAMGTQSTPEIVGEIVRQADAAGIESAWIAEHIAIPPDDAEGSGGRYLDPLSTLGWMAGQTRRIKVGTGVLVLPYRPALPTAKALATIQELSGGRLLVGVGVGWMQAEFDALGVARQQRGEITDSMLAFIRECFANDVVEANGQAFLFKPRPARPPIYVGGAAPHAIARTLEFGDGWMPMGRLEKLRPQIVDFKDRARERGHPGEVVMFGSLDERDPGAARAVLEAHREAGVTRLVVGRKYDQAEQWLPTIELIAELAA